VFKLALPTPADTTAPAVRLTAPAPGASVAGTITVSADARDNVGVAGVQFTVDGANLGAEDTSAPYSVGWDTSSVANGSHTLGAVARDAAGNAASATTVTVTVANATAVPPAGLVAAYAFNEGSGSLVVDASGRGNAGTTTNTSWLAAGKFGGALSFDGTSSWVTVPDAGSLDLTTGMTLEAWVKPSALGSRWCTVVFKQQPIGMAYSLYADAGTGNPLGQVNIGGEQNAFGAGSLPLDEWSHLAVTYDGAQLSLYVNGALAGSKAQTGSILVSSDPLRIGGNSIWSEWFAGAIDEVRVYDRALAAAEIQSDMVTPIGVPLASPPPTLVGDEQVEPDVDPNVPGLAEAFPATASTSGTLRTLNVYVDASSTATSLAAGIYSDAAGHPATLLARGTVTAPSAGRWNAVAVPAVPLAAGTRYWIAVLGPSGTLAFRDRCCSLVGDRPTETNADETLAALPATWTTGTVYDDGPISAYGSG
jgi:hypothetical protein